MPTDINEFFQDFFDQAAEDMMSWTSASLSNFGMRIVAALGVLIIGRFVIRFIVDWSDRAMHKAHWDETLVRFLAKLLYISLIAFLIISALTILGFPTTSLIAVLGAFSLAIGLAMQDSLANFASGILIIVLRPYSTGDLVEISDETGYVDEIRFFHTVLRLRDNKVLFVPNSDVMDGNIINYSEMEWVRLNLTYGIGYGDDLLKAKQILEEIVSAESRAATDPAPIVAVRELGDSSVNFAVMPYVKEGDMVPVTFAITEQVKLRFDAEGISIPFPQRDVHLIPAEA